MTAPGRLRLVKGQQTAAASDEIAAANPDFAAAMPMGNLATPQAKAVPLEAHLAALRMLEEAQARERAVQEDVRRLERQHLAMGFELTRYQAALEANSSSLVEREARTKEAEARLVEARRQATEAEARARLVDAERELRLEAEAKTARAREEAQSLQIELEEEKADARELSKRVTAEQEALGEAQHLADVTLPAHRGRDRSPGAS